MAENQERRRNDLYETYLHSAPVDDLKWTAKSAEVDERTKAEVVAHLNKHHPDWSRPEALTNEG